jgi:hypothetical protein
MEIRFDDTTEIKSITSHYFKDDSSAIAEPQVVAYEYLERSGDNDEVYEYKPFGIEKRYGAGPQITSKAMYKDSGSTIGETGSGSNIKKRTVMADGIRITVKTGGEWTFIDEIMVM